VLAPSGGSEGSPREGEGTWGRLWRLALGGGDSVVGVVELEVGAELEVGVET
jgi:hypothetical protein